MNGFEVFVEMSDLNALFAAMQNNQFDNLPKLVSADYLDDNADADLAAYLRAAVSEVDQKTVTELREKVEHNLIEQGITIIGDTVFEKHPEHDEQDAWWKVGPGGVTKMTREHNRDSRAMKKVPIGKIPHNVLKGLILLLAKRAKNPSINTSVFLARITNNLLEIVRNIRIRRDLFRQTGVNGTAFRDLAQKKVLFALEETEKYLDHIKNNHVAVPQHLMEQLQNAVQAFADALQSVNAQERPEFVAATRILKKF